MNALMSRSWPVAPQAKQSPFWMCAKCGSLPDPPQKGQVQVALRIAVVTGGICLCPRILHHAPPLATVRCRILQQCLSVANRPCHACNTTSSLDAVQPLMLLGFDATSGGFDLNGGEHRHLTANHVCGDGARGPADKVAAANA